MVDDKVIFIRFNTKEKNKALSVRAKVVSISKDEVGTYVVLIAGRENMI